MSSTSDWCSSTLRGPCSCECLVPKRGLEPPRALAHYPLKIACLPIPPLRLRHARPECASDRALNHISQTHCRGDGMRLPHTAGVGMTTRRARRASPLQFWRQLGDFFDRGTLIIFEVRDIWIVLIPCETIFRRFFRGEFDLRNTHFAHGFSPFTSRICESK